MVGSPHAAITDLLRAAGEGDRAAFDQLFPVVYDELRRLAHWVRQRKAGETVSTTVLVHEAYLKLLPSAHLKWQDRAHFFAIAARAMRQVLVSTARERLALKRGGGDWMITLDEDAHVPAMRPERMLALDDALERLAAMDERQSRIVECRFFAGLTVEETGEVLGVSAPTVKREWRAARAWMAAEMKRHES